MAHHEIELLNTTTGDPRLHVIHASDIGSMEIYKAGEAWTLLRFGSNQSSTAINHLLISLRVEHCKAGYDDIDDPIARPALALAQAMRGLHSQSFTTDDIAKICESYMTASEFKMAEAHAANMVKHFGISPNQAAEKTAEGEPSRAARPRV